MTPRRLHYAVLFALLVGVSAGCSSPPSSQAPTEGDPFAANQAWRSRILEQAAAGDAEAQRLLGLMYYQPPPGVFGYLEGLFSDGTKSFGAKDYAQAVSWFRKAAEQGDARAQYMLATMHENDVGVPQENINLRRAQAVFWYGKAAEQGIADAQFSLGNIYAIDQWIEGVAQDLVQAVAWYRRAAGQGHVRAQYVLGEMYNNGTGVAQDSVQAVIWYRRAAEQGHVPSQSYLAWMYDHGIGVLQDSTQALIWYRKAADQGDFLSQYYVGTMHQKGRGVPRDSEQADAWFRKATESSGGRCEVELFNLAAKYDLAPNVPPHDQRTTACYYKAAEQGSAPAQFTTGLRSYVGTAMFGASTPWFRKAADKGYAPAQLILGMSYARGAGVPQNAAEAVIWYRKAAEQGLADAQFRLAGC